MQYKFMKFLHCYCFLHRNNMLCKHIPERQVAIEPWWQGSETAGGRVWGNWATDRQVGTEAGAVKNIPEEKKKDLKSGAGQGFLARRWALVHGQLALNTGRSVSVDGSSAQRCYLYLAHTMASYTAGTGSQPRSLTTTKWPTLVTAMDSAPPAGEGAGKWERHKNVGFKNEQKKRW